MAKREAAGVTEDGTAAPERLSPREVRRRQRIELSREQMLETAEELFAERGYYATNLKDVAQRCEFSVGSIYSFFDSKEALYLAVLMRRGPGRLAEMKRLAAAPERAAGERFVALVTAELEHRRKYPAWAQLHAQMTKVGGRDVADVPPDYKDFHRETVRILAGVVADGQADGTIRPGDPHALARMCSALIDSFTLMDPMISDEPAGIGAEEFLTFVRETFTVA
ncbi:TetR/AcrR family transcriptional regulator [Actinomadura sp. WAC 06369]|uniref:TetR/AcrR family transcriptional regulator n=1 Tax=Actinomadura sp. WAC 06369 TaxID=2203193 RepID=UPI000F7A3348|nr:TetR/AcrR family transcriptional regulator [Actinomadura sp. WAC 06369]RSN57912.1 TetR/AcrR family transcriptional regulator [Actinomadura sp. WAC 06369]